MDRLQGIHFFRSKRHYPQRVLRNRNQLIKFREIQFAKQFWRVRPFVLRCKVRAFQIAAQDLRAGATGMTAPGNAPLRAMDRLQRSGDGGRQKRPHAFTRFVHG